jgi:Big-like domain-containing protein
MTGPAEKSESGEKHSGGFAQVVRWLTEERPIAGPDDVGFVAGAPRRSGRWTYGDPPARPSKPEIEVDVLAEVRIGPAPRCAVAGETIALSVSLVNTRGHIYLGWPVKLEWSSSDPSVATVNEYGVVDVHTRGRVELTCTCEGISGSVLLTVVEPAVAAAVGLPVPGRLVPETRPAPETRRAPEPPPVHRRSIERGSARHGALAALALSRGSRRFLFRLAVGAATGAIIAIVLARSPEEYFVVSAEPTKAIATRRTGTTARRPSVVRAASRPGVAVPASVASSASRSAVLGDTSSGATLTRGSGRVVSEAAGSAAITPVGPSATTIAPAQPAVATAVPRPAPAVSRVVVASSPSQLIEGESVRLSAAGVDDRGEAVAGRAVAWRSEDDNIASVDENGVVTARRPGTVTIVATSEGRTGRVTLSVGARRAVETPAPVAAPSRANSAAAAGQVMRARIEEFVTALRERNSSRVAALYGAESPQDRKNLQALLERMRRPETRLKASDAQLGALEVREMEAGVDFQVPMSWTTPFGRVRSQTSTFRAVLEPGDDGWRLVAIRAVGKID